ncbi:MAG: ATP-dependent DNA helicase RecG, partial [Actinomycetia bacterium]|nr:ATP-dependent DNA helicase RecG [Actinomycetes bacterium]
MPDPLSAPLTTLRHVEGKRAKLFENLGIATVGDLLLHLPFRYLDLSCVAKIGDQFEGDVTCSGTITSIKVKRPRPKLRITEVALTDETGTVLGVWFNQPWVEAQFRVGQ